LCPRVCSPWQGGPQGVCYELGRTPCREKRGEAFSKLRFPWKWGTNVETAGCADRRASRWLRSQKFSVPALRPLNSLVNGGQSVTFHPQKMTRRQWFLSSGAALTAASGAVSSNAGLALPQTARSTDPRTRPRTIKFLFFDPWALETVRGFQRRLGQPLKYSGNPILKPERSYEFSRVHLYGTVLRDPESNVFKM